MPARRGPTPGARPAVHFLAANFRVRGAVIEPEFWKTRWAAGQIAFHQAKTNPHLERHLAWLTGGVRARLLVPLCGKSNDLAYLANLGHPVVGIEMVEQAVVDFFAEHALVPTRAKEEKLERFTAEEVELLRADFFDVTRADVGSVSGAFDRAALIALPPELRARYVPHLVELLAPGARILLVTLNYDQLVMSGPPFSVPGAEVRALFAPTCEVELLEQHECLEEADNARFKTRGLRSMEEQVWSLRVR